MDVLRVNIALVLNLAMLAELQNCREAHIDICGCIFRIGYLV